MGLKAADLVFVLMSLNCWPSGSVTWLQGKLGGPSFLLGSHQSDLPSFVSKLDFEIDRMNLKFAIDRDGGSPSCLLE